jgi:hypothetical protein
MEGVGSLIVSRNLYHEMTKSMLFNLKIIYIRFFLNNKIGRLMNHKGPKDHLNVILTWELVGS